MSHRSNKMVLTAGITVAVIAALAGPATARASASAQASTPVPVDITGDITWTLDHHPIGVGSPDVTGDDKETGTFHIALTNVTNGGQAAGGNSSTYSVTDNLNWSFGRGDGCTVTDAGSYTGSGSLLYSPTGQLQSPFAYLDVAFNPSLTAMSADIVDGYIEQATRTFTGNAPNCSGTFPEPLGPEGQPECLDSTGDELGLNGTLTGTYPNATVDLGCSGTYTGGGTFTGGTDTGSFSVTGTLTITPACAGAAVRVRADTGSRPMTSTPSPLSPAHSLPVGRQAPAAAGHQASPRGAGSGNSGGLTVTITNAVMEPPPKPANQKPSGAYFSIPRPGQQNAWQRFYDLYYTVTEGSADVTGTANVTNATVELDDSVGNVLQQNIVNEGPGSDGKVSAIGCGIMRVQVTYGGGPTSTVDSTPPPANQIEYKFTLSAQDPATGASGTSADFTSQPVYALWKMPDGLPRFSPCGQAGHDTKGPGGDDWVSQSTYNWITANQQLLSAINNISFEHGMNLGPHQTHGTGNDIDMFHVYGGLTGASHCSGTEYYNTLVQTVRNALTGNAAAQQQVTNWVNQTRTRFDQLLPIAKVRYLIYARGAEAAATTTQPGLPLGWAQDLLTQGTFTNATGQTLTVASAWANGTNRKMIYRTDHDNHIHLSLAPA